MKKLLSIINMVGVLVLFLIFGTSVNVYADGTETLGPPLGINIANGSGIAAGGTGMVTQPGTITVNVPAGVIVKQVLLYWDGQSIGPVPGDDSISVNSIGVTGDLIGGPAFFFDTTYSGSLIHVWSSSFRADITSLNLVTPGLNTLTLDDMDYSWANNGAGVLVIYDNGSVASDIQVRDGLDLAFINFPEPRKSTVAQTFNMTPAGIDRTAKVLFFVGSVHDDRQTITTDRPNSIEAKVTVGGLTTPYVYSNFLSSINGLYWDSLMLDVLIPAGATELTIQVFSRDDLISGNLPASLEWIGGVVSVPTPPPVCGTGSPGYWKNHPDDWPVSNIIIGGKGYPRDNAIRIMKTSGNGDKCFTMFDALVSAKLNVLRGNPSSCIDATITEADIWMDAWCVNEPKDFYDDNKKTVSGSSPAWQSGEPLYWTLDAYNNGLLCADKCEEAHKCTKKDHRGVTNHFSKFNRGKKIYHSSTYEHSGRYEHHGNHGR